MGEKKPSHPPSRRPPVAAKGPRPPPLPRRDTIEVDVAWLEEERNAPSSSRGAKSSSKTPSVRTPSARGLPAVSGPPRRETMEVHLDWLEEVKEEVAKPGSKPPKRHRNAWEPPTLPPPPPTAARARKVIPPPLPREEEDKPKRPSKAPGRASKPPSKR